jgi:ribosome maturation protein SDO1
VIYPVVTLDDAIIVRYKGYGKKFEIFADPDLAFALRTHEIEDVDPDKLLAVEEIFEDAQEGKKVSKEALIEVFGTDNIYDVAKKIIDKGELGLTAKQRKDMKEKKRRQIISLIAKDAINPQTNTPHPPARIERAMEEARVNIDPFKNTEELLKEVIKAIRPIIPIKFEKLRIAVKIPPEYAGKSYGAIANFADIKREEWGADGSWIALVEVSASLQSEFYGLVNKLTKGEGETKIIKDSSGKI